MSNLYNDRYDEIKNLLKKSKLIFEQETQVNVAKDLEKRISRDNEYETADSVGEEKEKSPEDKVQKYRISGGILALHGKTTKDVEITTDEKVAFQETMNEFVEEVSDLADFDVLNVYSNSVEWSGKLIDEDLEYIFRIGEDSGIYINGQMVKMDEGFLETINKLEQFYQKFKSKWGKVLGTRKKTKDM
jgi:hypothetical protein